MWRQGRHNLLLLLLHTSYSILWGQGLPQRVILFAGSNPRLCTEIKFNLLRGTGGWAKSVHLMREGGGATAHTWSFFFRQHVAFKL